MGHHCQRYRLYLGGPRPIGSFPTAEMEKGVAPVVLAGARPASAGLATKGGPFVPLRRQLLPLRSLVPVQVLVESRYVALAVGAWARPGRGGSIRWPASSNGPATVGEVQPAAPLSVQLLVDQRLGTHQPPAKLAPHDWPPMPVG
jgi:hypothetical protein